MAFKGPQAPKEFDAALLQSMTEPLTVRVDRRVGGQSEPILTETEKTIADVMGTKDSPSLEQWIVESWSGGGNYVASVTDSQGKTMRWTFYYPETQYPPRPPGQDAQAAQPRPAPASPYYRGPTGWGPQAWQGQPQNWNGQWNGQGPGPGFPPQGWPPPPDPRVDALREELAAERSRAAEERHRQEIAATKAEGERQMQALREEMRALRESLAQRPSVDDETRRRLDEAERRREADAAENRHREEMRAQREATAQQIAALQAALTERRPDAIIEMLKAITERGTDAQRESAREFTAAMERMLALVMKPQDYALLAQQIAASSDSRPLMQTFMDMYKGASDLQDRLMQRVLDQAQGAQPHPAFELIGQGLQQTQVVLQDYFRTQIAKENARARMAGGPPRQPPREIAAAGMQGASAEPAAAAAPPRRAAPGAGPVPVNGAQPKPIRTDAEWFGLATQRLPEIRTMAGQSQPETIVEIVVGALTYYADLKPTPVIPAFDLINNGRYQEFFALLLPDMPDHYVRACAELFDRVAQGGPLEEGGGDEEEDGGGGDDASPAS